MHPNTFIPASYPGNRTEGPPGSHFQWENPWDWGSHWPPDILCAEPVWMIDFKACSREYIRLGTRCSRTRRWGWLVFLCYSTQGWAQLVWWGSSSPTPLVRCEKAWLQSVPHRTTGAGVCCEVGSRSTTGPEREGREQRAARRLWSVFPGSLSAMLMVHAGD